MKPLMHVNAYLLLRTKPFLTWAAGSCSTLPAKYHLS